MSRFQKRLSAAEARRHATRLLDGPLSRVPDAGVELRIAGSLRREPDQQAPERIGDLDLMVIPTGDGALFGAVALMSDLPWPAWVKATPKKASGWAPELDGVQMFLDAWLCPADSVGPFGMFLTGPPELNVWMRQRANAVGLMLSQYGLFTVDEVRTVVDDLDAQVPAVVKRVPKERLDDPVELGQTVVACERVFWRQFVDRCGMRGLEFPEPRERNSFTERMRGIPNTCT